MYVGLRLCSSVDRHFQRNLLSQSSTMKIEDVGSSETPVPAYQMSRPCNSQDRNLSPIWTPQYFVLEQSQILRTLNDKVTPLENERSNYNCVHFNRRGPRGEMGVTVQKINILVRIYGNPTDIQMGYFPNICVKHYH
jgi:hypothetical protein